MHTKIFVCLAFIIACTYAQVSQPPDYKERYPEIYKFAKQARHPRDVTWDKQVGHGKVFGTLGQNDEGLFGKGGYKGEIFNDHRGKLDGEAYGKRILGPNGDSSNLGGQLNWSNDNAKAGLNLNRQIGGKTSVKAEGAGVWKLDKNTHLSAGGSVSQRDINRGKPDVALEAKIEHKF